MPEPKDKTSTPPPAAPLSPDQLQQLQQMFDDMREEKELISWQAPSRTFRHRDKDFWVTTIAILVLVSVILIFVKEFFLIVALASALFLYYVLSAIPPEKTTNRITNRGVHFGELFYPWDDLSRFWIKPVFDKDTVFLETKLRFPREIALILEGNIKDEVKTILLKYLPLIESSPRFVDKTTDWLAKKLPLEDKQK